MDESLFKLPCRVQTGNPRQGQKPVLAETAADETVSNHLPAPKTRSASINCIMQFFVHWKQIGFSKNSLCFYFEQWGRVIFPDKSSFL